jgi:hypothetical protein
VAWTGPRDAPLPDPVRLAPVPAPPVLPGDGSSAGPAQPATGATPRTVLLEPPTSGETSTNAAATAPSRPQPEPAPVVEVALETAPDAGAQSGGQADEMVRLRKLVNESKTRLDALVSYQTLMTRQERVGETLLSSEEVLLSLRRKPLAVRLEWPSGPSKGREVLYSPVETEGKMQIYAPNSLVPRLSLSPESPLVLKNSRHPITEAGFDSVLRNMDAALHAAEQRKTDAGRFRYEGVQVVPEVGRECHRIVETRANGETWVVCLDAESMLPALVHATDAQGQLLESYRFRDVSTNLPDLATAAAFSPSQRWGDNRSGVLGRIARGLGEQAAPK